MIDIKIRDICEYFKSQAFKNENLILDIKEYLNKSVLTTEECQLFFIRLIYPTFYFDEFEKIMNNDLSDDSIKKYIDERKKYENIIKKTYQLLADMSKLPNIEWLNVSYF